MFGYVKKKKCIIVKINNPEIFLSTFIQQRQNIILYGAH